MMKDFDNKILDKYFNKYYSSSAKDDYKSWLINIELEITYI